MANVRKTAAFHVEALDTRYVIYIDKPKPLPPEGERWIAVLCLDGDDQFTEMRKAREAAAKDGGLPPLLLVGVGYGAGYASPQNRRLRDYTPGPDAEAEGEETGGAEAFVEFLTRTLWPELERRYPVDTRVRGLAGHSLGGLLGLHALFRGKPFFNRVLAGAPSIWWGERAVLRTVAERQEKRGMLAAKLFVGIGLKDGKSMRGDVDTLEKQLAERPVPGLEVAFERFPGRTHYTSIGPGFRAGLRALFGERVKAAGP